MQFSCTRCGQCCEGQGGIVLCTTDLERLSHSFDITIEQFTAQYAEEASQKLRVKTIDGKCVFYREGVGCAVHLSRPNICRAWPYFRGNLIDKESFSLAKEYCPGIPHDMAFEDFIDAGKNFLHEHDLLTKGFNQAAALSFDDIFEIE